MAVTYKWKNNNLLPMINTKIIYTTQPHLLKFYCTVEFNEKVLIK